MKKLLFFDVETTGTDCAIHEIVQFAAIAELNGELYEINKRIRPENIKTIEQRALDVTGLTLADLMGYQPKQEAYTDIVEFLDRFVDKYDRNDKFYPCGHNVRFDLGFLNSFFESCGNRYGSGTYQNWKALDTRQLLDILSYRGDLVLADHKLETACNHFGIEINAHDALSDVQATRELFYKLMPMIGG